jgi:hypothetical protein
VLRTGAWRGQIAGKIRDRHGLPDKALDCRYLSFLVGLGEADRVALGACAGCAADAVHVVFGLHRHIEIDDEVYPLHVDTACRDIGRDKDAILAGLESLKRFLALIERTIAVDLSGGVAHARYFAAEAFCAELHAREHDSRAGVFRENAFEKRYLLRLRDDEEFLRHPIGGGARRSHFYLHGHLHVMGSELADLARKRRREETGLALLGHGFDDALDLRPEAHVEHAIGLVYHEVVDATEADRALAHVIDEAARCRDDDIRTTTECFLLRAHASAADEDRSLDPERASYLAERLIDLEREFARRSQYERERLTFEHVGDHRDAECERLAGTRLRDTDHVFSLYTGGDRLALDRRGNSEPELLERRKDSGCDSERMERGLGRRLTALRGLLCHEWGNYSTK